MVKWSLNTNTLLLILLFSVMIGLRAYNLTGKSLWMDEIRQARISNNNFLKSVGQQQPPISYLTEAILFKILGFNELTARLNPFIFSLLAGILLYLFAKETFGKNIALVSLCLYSISPLFILYAQEARPYATGVFGFVLFLYGLTKATSRKAIFWYGFLMAGTLFLLFSIGLQPMLLLIPFICWFIYKFLRHRTRSDLIIGILLTVGLIVYLPFHFYMSKNNLYFAGFQGTHIFQIAGEVLGRFFTHADHLLHVINSDGDKLLSVNSLYYLVLILFVPFAFVRIKNESIYLLAPLKITFAAFPILFCLIFFGLTSNTDYNNRYVILFAVVVLLLNAVGLIKLINYFLKSTNRIIYSYFAIGLFLLICFFRILLIPNVYDHTYPKEPWKQLFSWMAGNIDKDSILIVDSFREPYFWEPEAFYGEEVYGIPSRPYQHHLFFRELPRLILSNHQILNSAIPVYLVSFRAAMGLEGCDALKNQCQSSILEGFFFNTSSDPMYNMSIYCLKNPISQKLLDQIDQFVRYITDTLAATSDIKYTDFHWVRAAIEVTKGLAKEAEQRIQMMEHNVIQRLNLITKDRLNKDALLKAFLEKSAELKALIKAYHPINRIGGN